MPQTSRVLATLFFKNIFSAVSGGTPLRPLFFFFFSFSCFSFLSFIFPISLFLVSFFYAYAASSLCMRGELSMFHPLSVLHGDVVS